VNLLKDPTIEIKDSMPSTLAEIISGPDTFVLIYGDRGDKTKKEITWHFGGNISKFEDIRFLRADCNEYKGLLVSRRFYFPDNEDGKLRIGFKLVVKIEKKESFLQLLCQTSESEKSPEENNPDNNDVNPIQTTDIEMGENISHKRSRIENDESFAEGCLSVVTKISPQCREYVQTGFDSKKAENLLQDRDCNSLIVRTTEKDLQILCITRWNPQINDPKKEKLENKKVEVINGEFVIGVNDQIPKNLYSTLQSLLEDKYPDYFLYKSGNWEKIESSGKVEEDNDSYFRNFSNNININ